MTPESNGEFSPTQIGGGTYRADYLAADAIGIYEYGTLSVSIPAGSGYFTIGPITPSTQSSPW